MAVALVSVAASSWASPPARSWSLTNLVKVARHRYPAYVGIRAVGLTNSGAVYWTAYRQYTDGKTLEVFRWKSGRLSDLGSPGPGLGVYAVNGRGQFVVETMPPPVPTGPVSSGVIPWPDIHAYLWQQGKLTPLGSLGGSHTFAQAINDRGQVVGSSDLSKSARVPLHAFLWQNGKMTDLGTLGGSYSEPTAINDRGQIIGTSLTASRRLHGFIWEHGKMTDLGTLGGSETRPVALNEHGQVIGQSTTPNGTAHHFDDGVAFVWQNGKMTRLPTLDLHGYPGMSPRSVPSAINDRGEIVGISETSDAAGRAFLWQDGRMVDLGTLGGRSSHAAAIDDRGDVVGWSDTKLVPWTAEQAPRPRPVLWQDGVKVELPVDYPSPTEATTITPSGNEILGAGGWPPHQALLWIRS